MTAEWQFVRDEPECLGARPGVALPPSSAGSSASRLFRPQEKLGRRQRRNARGVEFAAGERNLSSRRAVQHKGASSLAVQSAPHLVQCQEASGATGGRSRTLELLSRSFPYSSKICDQASGSTRAASCATHTRAQLGLELFQAAFERHEQHRLFPAPRHPWHATPSHDRSPSNC